MQLEELKLQRFYLPVSFNLKYLHEGNCNVTSEVDKVLGQFLVRLEHFVYSKTLDVIEVKYPASWWQHFKQAFFPQWLLRYFPVKETVVKYDVAALYPDITPKIYNCQPYLRVMPKEM